VTPVEFRLRSGAPGTKFVVRFVWAFVWIGEAVTVFSLAIGTVDLFTAILIGSFLLFMGAATRWSQARYGEGTAYLDDHGLVVRTRGGTHYYKWDDIDSVRIRPFADKGPVAWLARRMIGGEAKQRVVKVKLRRSLRLSLSLWGNKFGTDIVGIPSLVLRRTVFYMENPDDFALAATALIRRRSATGASRDTKGFP
jgi:hypothetical protein